MPNIFQNKKVLIVVAIVVSLLLGLTFWLLQPKPTQKITTNNSPVTLTWWKIFYGNDVYSEIINDFRKTPGNENVTINVVTRDYSNSSAYYKSLISDIAAGAGPDIFTLRNDDLAAYQKYMTPITSFEGAKLADYKNNFVPLAVKDTMVKDKVYAITSYVDNLALYYNTDILSQAGIALPATTWKDLDIQLPSLNKRDISGTDFTQSAIAFGTGFDSKESGGNINRFQDIIPALMFQNGAQLYDYQTNSSVFGKGSSSDKNNPTYNALRFYYDFADSTTNRYSWNSGQSNNIDEFAEGRLAYIVHYSYLKDILAQKNSRLAYKIAPIPQIDLTKKKTYGFFFMDGLNRKLQTDVENFPTDATRARKLQAASSFMEFLSQKSAQSKFAATTRLPSAHKQVINEQLSRDDSIRIFAAGSLYADNYYKPDIDRMEKLWGQILYRTIYENQPLSDSLQQAVSEYEKIISLPAQLRG
jgi:ABC-type glycerol-3-phosphate transport system substrate-binding protein